MSVLPISSWYRVLGWGLVASLVLHWVAFDLMRAAAWIPSAPGAAVLQVKLQEAVIPVPQPGELPAVASVPATRPAPSAAAATRAKASPEPARVSSAETLAHAPSDARLALIQPGGMRSGRPVEAMVALRLSIAESLARSHRSAPSFVLAQAVLLMCDFDATGRLLAVRDISGAASSAVLASTRRAVEQVVLPQTLVGQAFSLDVLLESGD